MISSRWLVRANATSILGACILLTSPLVAETRSPADLEVERCLGEGKVLDKGKALIGITAPKRHTLECDGRKMEAVFKDVDETRRGLTKFDEGRSEINFTDSYRYERAAYLLDRELGMGRVPVAVIRTVRGRRGCLIEWLENAVMEMQLDRELSTAERVELASQKATMHLFDALIYNTDRRVENWLIDREDLSLYLIDHSRAFRWQHTLPEEFVARPTRLSRELYANLQGLNEPGLTALLEGMIDSVQIRALLVRRDLILEKIEQDLASFGEAVVFTD
jgi:hypothetical protein